MPIKENTAFDTLEFMHVALTYTTSFVSAGSWLE